MSSNIFDLFNSSKILDKHGKKIHLKIAKGSITWDKLGDDVKRRILGIEANIDSLYNYVRQLVPDMNYHSVTLVEAVGIRYIDNHQSIIIDGQNYSIIVEAKEHYNLSDVIVTIGSDAYSLSDIESMEDKFTVDSYTETRLSFTILNVTDNIRIEGVAEEEEGSLVSLESGEGYKWVDEDGNDASGFYARYNEENTYYIVITDSGKSFDEIEGENCNAVAGEEEDGKIPVTIKQVTGDARVFVSLADNTVSVRTNNANPNFKVLIDDNEVTLPQSVSIGSTHTIKVEPNTNYYFNTAPTSDGEVVFTSNGDGSYSYTFEGIQEDIVIYGNALANPKVMNNTQGFNVTINGTSIDRGSANAIPYAVNTPLTIVLTIPNDKEYSVKTQPSITGISGVTFTQSGNTYTASVTIGESDITINGVIEEVLQKIYYGIIPRTSTGFNADTINNGNGTVSELVNNNYINLQNLTEVDSDISQQQLSATPLDYIICLIDVTLSKKSMVYNEVTQSYDLYTSGFGSNYFYNGESTITYSSSGHTYKVYCQMAQSSYNIKISTMNN